MKINNPQKFDRTKSMGFTIVELIVVIVILGILSSIVIFLYDNIGTRAYDVSIQSDLENAKADLELYSKNNNGYPTVDTALNNGVGFIESEGNTLTYIKKTYGYCLYGNNPEAEHTFMTRSIEGKIIEGDCRPEAKLLAGSGTSSGYVDGTGTDARFNGGDGSSIVTTPTGDIYVSDYNNGRIRKVTPEGVVTTIAGGNSGCVAGVGSAAGLGLVTGITYDSLTKTIYFLGCSGGSLFKLTTDGTATIINNTFYWARGLTFGPDRTLYVIGTENHRIYKVNPSTGVATVFAGSGTAGYANGMGAAAQFNWPWTGVFDSSGNLIVKDARNYRLRTIEPNGNVTNFSGTGVSGITNGGPSVAQYYHFGPHGMTIDKLGTFYVYESNSLRTVSPTGDAAFTQPLSSTWWSSTSIGHAQAMTVGNDGYMYGVTPRGVVKVTL